MNKLDFILRLKAYEVFLLILAGGILKNIDFGDSLLNTLFSLIGILLYAGWPILVGHALYQRNPDLIKWNYQAFSLSSGIWLLAILAKPLVSVWTGLQYIDVLTVPGALLVFVAACYSILYTAKMIESVENRKEVDGLESLGVLLLILILPIGIWFLQPMLNKVVGGVQESPQSIH